MKVNDVVKKALERLRKESKQLTPDYYAEAFCAEAKKMGVSLEDCSRMERFFESMDETLRNEALQYKIKTVPELVRFLISRLTRMSSTRSGAIMEQQLKLLKKVLEAAMLLHNKEASTLADKTLKALNESHNPDQLDYIRQAWDTFITNYDNAFLERLSAYTEVDKADIVKTVESIEADQVERIEQSKLHEIAELFSLTFIPSIVSKIDEKTQKLVDTIKEQPNLLGKQTITEDIKKAVKLRIGIDKSRVKRMVTELNSVLDRLSKQLVTLIERSDQSNAEIITIKKELNELDQKKDKIDYKTTHNRLFNIAVKLQEQTEVLSYNLKKHNSKVFDLNARIGELEKELEEAQKASIEDFLTKLYNRRALDDFLTIKEDEYSRYDDDYIIVLFDLDYFKNINDTYGHDAGDAVLEAVAKVIKSQIRKSDIIGRYGGEEFMAILAHNDKEGAITFAHKVNERVKGTKFMFKGVRINVTISAGVALRSEASSLENVVTTADELLYKAKSSGRDRIEA